MQLPYGPTEWQLRWLESSLDEARRDAEPHPGVETTVSDAGRDSTPTEAEVVPVANFCSVKQKHPDTCVPASVHNVFTDVPMDPDHDVCKMTKATEVWCKNGPKNIFRGSYHSGPHGAEHQKLIQGRNTNMPWLLRIFLRISPERSSEKWKDWRDREVCAHVYVSNSQTWEDPHRRFLEIHQFSRRISMGF